jgi:hypothetical protein
MSPSTDTRENREFASELKFLIAPERAAEVRRWARGRLQPDPHAGGASGDGYQITSLYFDTEQFDVFHRRGSFGRSKYRIRRYGAGELVFLERKLKTRGLLSKRRSILRFAELADWSGDGEGPAVARWFQRRIAARRLRPVCQIAYQRTARVAMTEFGPIRLTLDESLRALPVDRVQFSAAEGQGILEDRVILELKFRHGLPALFKYLVEEFALTPKPFSKYRLAVAQLGMVAKAIDATARDGVLTPHPRSLSPLRGEGSATAGCQSDRGLAMSAKREGVGFRTAGELGS